MLIVRFLFTELRVSKMAAWKRIERRCSIEDSMINVDSDVRMYDRHFDSFFPPYFTFAHRKSLNILQPYCTC